MAMPEDDDPVPVFDLGLPGAGINHPSAMSKRVTPAPPDFLPGQAPSVSSDTPRPEPQLTIRVSKPDTGLEHPTPEHSAARQILPWASSSSSGSRQAGAIATTVLHSRVPAAVSFEEGVEAVHAWLDEQADESGSEDGADEGNDSSSYNGNDRGQASSKPQTVSVEAVQCVELLRACEALGLGEDARGLVGSAVRLNFRPLLIRACADLEQLLDDAIEAANESPVAAGLSMMASDGVLAASRADWHHTSWGAPTRSASASYRAVNLP